MANGPSLNLQDLRLLKNEVVIAVNSFYHHADLETISPAFWIVADPLYWEDPKTYLMPLLEGLQQTGGMNRLFIPTGAFQLMQQINYGPSTDVHYFHYDWSIHDPLEIDFSRPVPPFGQNVVSTALMLALHLGGHPIYLLGCDHNWWAWTAETYHESHHEHFYKGPTLTIQEEMGFEQLQRTIVVQRHQYEVLHAFARDRGVAILNATEGGVLDVFPRVAYRDLFPAPVQGRLTPSELVRSGLRALEREDWAGAVGLLEHARELGIGRLTGVPGVELALAVALARLGHREAARTWLHELRTADPRHEMRSRHLLQSLDSAVLEALPDAAELGEWLFPDLDPGAVSRRVSLLERLGEQRFEAGDTPGARQAFEEALELQPDSSAMFNNLGVLHWQEGDADEALQAFTRALELDPGDRNALDNLVAIHQSRGAERDILAACDAYLAMSPADAEILALRDEVRARLDTPDPVASMDVVDLFPASTVHGCITAHLARDPGGVAFWLREGGQWVPHRRGDFLALVERHAARFASELEPGSLVLFIKRLDVHLLAAYIGAMWAGLVPAQLSPLTRKTSSTEYARKIAHIFDLTGARGVFTDASEADTIPSGPRIFTPESLTDLPPVPPAQDETTALVQFSSGSTGLQKGVLLSHRSILAHMRSYAEALQLSPEDRLVSWLPLYHDMGLVACFLMPLMAGVPFLQMDPFDWLLRPDLLLEAIEEHRATVCFLPNFAYHLLVRKGKKRDLSSMRAFVNCSEPARHDTHEVFRGAFPSVSPGALTVCYALAENTFAVSQTFPGEAPHRATIAGKELLSCGRVMPGTEIRILDPDPEGVGEIGLKGACRFDRFLGGEAPMDGDYYRTGDLGAIGPDGELYVTGRKKDLVICNGKNLYPQDVEHVASMVAGVYPGRVVAFGVENHEVGSEELIVVVERDGSVADGPLKLAVQRAVEQEVGVLPRRVEVVDHMQLVKTSSGKISRARNKELYVSGELR